MVHRAEGLTCVKIVSIFLHEARCRIPLAPFATLKRSTERIASRDYYRPRCSLSSSIEIPLGIDEIALRKGKGDFALILTNLDTKKGADVHKARTQEKLSTRLGRLSSFERAQIQEVANDMWKPHDTVCAELLPHAVITADRLHVMQAVNRELKQLKNQQKKAHSEILKGVHYTLLKNRQDLTHKQQAALERVYQVSPLVKTAHRLKECLRHIFECKSTKEKATERLRKWCLIAEKADSFRSSVEHWQTRYTGLPNTFVTARPVASSKASTTKPSSSSAGLLDFATLSTVRIRVIAAFL